MTTANIPGQLQLPPSKWQGVPRSLDHWISPNYLPFQLTPAPHEQPLTPDIILSLILEDHD